MFSSEAMAVILAIRSTGYQITTVLNSEVLLISSSMNTISATGVASGTTTAGSTVFGA